MLLIYRGLTLLALMLPLMVAYPLITDDLIFTECGGDPISSVSIVGCNTTPCTLVMGSSYDLNVELDYINPQVDDSAIAVNLRQFGFKFSQNSSTNNPCIYGCPITTRLEKPQFNVTFSVGNLAVLSAELVIEGSYVNSNSVTTGFCFEVPVSVVRSL